MEEYDLSRGLRDLSGAPRIEGPAVPVERVSARVRRGRTVRAAGVSAACVAALVGVAGVVWAASPWGDPVAPAQTETPTASPTPVPTPTADPTPEVTEEPTASETEEPTRTAEPPMAPPLVALTAGGELVVLDEETFQVERVVREGVDVGDPARVSLVVAPDGSAVYLGTEVTGEGQRRAGTIERVDLTDGSTEVVGEGWRPSLSPDGTLLAFAGHDPAGTVDELGDPQYGLRVLDLGSGELRFLSTGVSHQEYTLASGEWSSDGTLWLSLGSSNGQPTALAPDADTLDDGRAAPVTQERAWDHLALLTDRRAAIAFSGLGHGATVDQEGVAVVDLESGEVLGKTRPGEHVRDVATRTADDRVLLVSTTDLFGSLEASRLRVWEPGAGSTASEVVAEGVVAVDW